MSHPANTELLETLYEEELEYFTNENKTIFNNKFTQDDLNNAAEIMARKRFDDLCY